VTLLYAGGDMSSYEYRITRHPAEAFRQVAVFCSDDGACKLEDIPDAQTRILTEILNDLGREGWELVQTLFGRGGMLAIWRRKLAAG